MILGNGLTIKETVEELKKDILAALSGRIRYDDEYSEPAGKEACDTEIIRCFDEIAGHAINAFAAGKALGDLAKDHGLDTSDPEILREYFEMAEKEKRKN